MTLQGGRDVPVTIWSKRPDRFRRHVELPETPITTAFDGTTFWTATGPADSNAEPVTGPAADRARVDARFDSVFLDYKARNVKMEVVSAEQDADPAAVRVRAIHPDGLVELYSLDSDTWLETRWERVSSRAGVPITLAREYSDYKSVEGLLFPFTIREFVNGVLVSVATFTAVELNPKLEDQFFRLPPGAR